MTKTWRVELAPSAVRDLNLIPPRPAAAVVEFVTGPLAEAPYRVGKPLRNELEGYHGGRRGDYRVLYRIIDPDRLVLVVRIDHRSTVYRPR